MLTFALDSSAKSGSAALLDGERVVASAYCDTGYTHSETLLPLCDAVFAAAKAQPREVGLFAVTCGPGSFTGLRIGIATIKGFAFLTDAPCAAISTTEALAECCRCFDGIAVPVLDARADRVYFSAFDASQNNKRLLKDEAEKIDNLPNLLKPFEKPVIFVGDASQLCYNRLKEKIGCEMKAGGLRAEYVALAGLRALAANNVVSAEALAPNYIQLPQAQRSLEQKENNR